MKQHDLLYIKVSPELRILFYFYKKLNFKAQPYYKEDSNRYTGSYMYMKFNWYET